MTVEKQPGTTRGRLHRQAPFSISAAKPAAVITISVAEEPPPSFYVFYVSRCCTDKEGVGPNVYQAVFTVVHGWPKPRRYNIRHSKYITVLYFRPLIISASFVRLCANEHPLVQDFKPSEIFSKAVVTRCTSCCAAVAFLSQTRAS